MWSRAELKYRAKNVLRGKYWKAFLVSLVITLVSEGFGGSSGRGGSSISSDAEPFYNFGFGTAHAVITGLLVAFFLTALLLSIFVFNPLEVGGRRYYVQSAQYFDSRKCFRFAFDG